MRYREGSIEIPFQVKRMGIGLKLIVDNKPVGDTVNPKLIALIQKAHQWFGLLRSGKANSISEIAQQEKVTGSYVTRILYLAFLSPDIIQSIMEGKQPLYLTAHALIRKGIPPSNWSEQWQWLGIAKNTIESPAH